MTDEPMREEPCSDTSTQRAQSDTEWTDWHWADSRIVRVNKRNIKQVEECSDCSYLESELITLEKIRQEYLERASRSLPARAKELMQGVSDKDRQIAWVKAKLESLSDNQPALAKSVSVEVVETVDALSSASLGVELTSDEQRDRLHLERKVERAFYEAGKALRELRSRRLYRSTHKTFEEYCQDRFGFTRRHINYLIAGSVVVDNLKMGTNRSQNLPTAPMGTNRSQILPTSEYQIRPLTKLEPSQQREVWQQAVAEAGGKVPSNRLVKSLVDQIKERTTAKEVEIAHHLKLSEGSLVEIHSPNNKKIHQRLGRIAAVKPSTVEVWIRDVDTMTMQKHTLKHQQVWSVPKEKEPQLAEVGARLAKLRRCSLDPFEVEILNLLARAVVLTPTETKYLKMLEDSQKTEQADPYKEYTRWEKSEKKSSLEKSGNPD